MEKIGSLEIKVDGKIGNQSLKPYNFDIKHLENILKDAEDLLFPENKKDRPIIAYDVADGSVRHIFKTSMQSIIALSAILTQVQKQESIDFLDIKTAKAIERIQNLSIAKDFEFAFKTSFSDKTELTITPSTKFFQAEGLWADAEFYFYGVLKDAGGKSKANIHLDTKEYGYLKINVDKKFLESQDKNLLYKTYGIKASGKQNTITGDIDTSSLVFQELINYNPAYDESYIDNLIAKASPTWGGIDVDSWLADTRGHYEL